MWPSRSKKLTAIKNGLLDFSQTKRRLTGVTSKAALETLAMQMVASLRRIDYTNALLARPTDPRRTDPNSALFDPERAAIYHANNGNLDEAVWLIFLSVHFGKHAQHNWRRLRDVYSGLGQGTWTWDRVNSNIAGFRAWLTANEGNIGGAFGNHRKYESLSGTSAAGTGAVIASYVDWVGPTHSHVALFAGIVKAAGNDPHAIFDHFYNEMNVHRFGRLGKFDFLALLGRLGFAPIAPGNAYLADATGPLKGARLLFSGNAKAPLKATDLQNFLWELDEVLKVGMQVMEDSLCNWQKSPEKFIHFKG